MASQDKQSSFTGHSRKMKTRWTVRAGDVLSKNIITIGGIGTIVSVLLVFVFLSYEAAPLFLSAETEKPTKSDIGSWHGKGRQFPVHLAVDEYRAMGFALYDDGTLTVFRYDNGDLLETRKLFEGKRLTAFSSTVGQSDVAMGFDDGTVMTGQMGFLRGNEAYKKKLLVLSLLDELELSESESTALLNKIEKLAAGESETFGKGVIQRTPNGEFRVQQVRMKIGQPVKVSSKPIRLLDHVAPAEAGETAKLGGDEYFCATLAGDDELKYSKLVERENQFTGETEVSAESTVIDFEPRSNSVPLRLMLPLLGNDNLYIAWADGVLKRFDIRKLDDIKLVEEIDLLTSKSAKLTTCEMILGRNTFVCGDTEGGLRAWFRTKRPEEEVEVGDGFQLTMVHDLGKADAAVTCVEASQRGRMIAVGYRDGALRVFHVTTRQELVDIQASEDAITNVLIAPKDDALIALTQQKMWQADFDPGHPEATVASLFLPVWYEGYNRPIFKWESTYATQAPEEKFGLFPLIFGTLKATFYTMIIAVPLALLAAIYTSEFLNPAWRMRVKPVIETMASLPSVVLGFLAAVLFAKYIEKIVPSVLAGFVVIPLCYLLGAFLWHLLPYRWVLRLQKYRILILIPPLVIGMWLAYKFFGPAAEVLFFAGDIKRWLLGQIGNGVGAWLLLTLPAGAVITAFIFLTYVNPKIRGLAERLSRRQFAWVNLGKFAVGVVIAFVGAWLFSYLLDLGGLDPRKEWTIGGMDFSPVGKFSQSNALVVGYVMGFAVIPIIYTIADDALHTVPDHLRSASLGCGATPWQTAIRIVIPTAMSGLFSAMMVGLGRAVGETMIVLMAGGNSPVMTGNMFEGFRTLSGNIAFELPEAAKHTTHYRTLFLAGLVLFVMTFFINTLAESVRIRFRKRAYQL